MIKEESKGSEKCIICHYWYLDEFQFVCNNCHDLLLIVLGINNIEIIHVRVEIIIV